jgi:hypothetical protein
MFCFASECGGHGKHGNFAVGKHPALLVDRRAAASYCTQFLARIVSNVKLFGWLFGSFGSLPGAKIVATPTKPKKPFC